MVGFKNLKRIYGFIPQMGFKIFYFFNRLVHNAPPAAAVRDLLVLIFAYHHRLQVWWMPASENSPHCSADGSLGAVNIGIFIGH